jgi:hypothetical protein
LVSNWNVVISVAGAVCVPDTGADGAKVAERLERPGTVLPVENEWVLDTVIDLGGVDRAGEYGTGIALGGT